MKKVTVRIASSIDSLTQKEHNQLAFLLKKLGFSDVGIGGGEHDVDLELSGKRLVTLFSGDDPDDVLAYYIQDENTIAASGEPMCGNKFKGFTCMLLKGHSGIDHVAHGPENEIIRRWPINA